MEFFKHNTRFDFMGKKWYAITFSTVVVLASLLSIFRLNWGVDFAGGTELQVKFGQAVDVGKLRHTIAEMGFKKSSVQVFGEEANHEYLVKVERVSLLSNEQAQATRNLIDKASGGKLDHLVYDEEVGDKVELRFREPVDAKLVADAAKQAGLHVSEVRGSTSGAATREYTLILEGISKKLGERLKSTFSGTEVKIQRVEFVGPAVGKQLRNRGFLSLFYALIGILIYVGFRFDFRFAPGGVIATLHDAIVTIGVYGFTGMEFNLTSVAAVLTIIGYSINDTIVVYDRIRESMGKYKGRPLTEIMNLAINETLSRTILTSVATALSLVGLLVYGVGTVRDFAVAMTAGIVFGTYSSIYVAAPLVIAIEELKGSWSRKKGQEPGRSAQRSAARA